MTLHRLTNLDSDHLISSDLLDHFRATLQLDSLISEVDKLFLVRKNS